MSEDINQEPENGQKTIPVCEDKIINLRPTMTPVKAAFLGLLIGLILFQIMGSIMSLLIMSLNPSNTDGNILRLLQLASQVLFLLLPGLVLSKMVYGDVTTVIRFHGVSWQEIGLFAIGMLIMTPLANNIMIIQLYYFRVFIESHASLHFISKFIEQMSTLIESTYKQLFTARTWYDSVIIFLTVTITPAVCEEVLFRGYVQTSFQIRYGAFRAAVITALFFALYHLNPAAFLGLFLLGLFFGWTAYKTNSIFIPILLHFLNNFFSLIVYLLHGPDNAETSMYATLKEAKQGFVNASYLAVLLVILIVVINKYYRRRQVLTATPKE